MNPLSNIARYNSAIFKSFGSNQYGIYFVDPSFLSSVPTPAAFTSNDQLFSEIIGQNITMTLSQFQQQAASASLKRLESVDCITTFEPAFQEDFRNVVVVAAPEADVNSTTPSTHPAFWAQTFTLHEGSWICALNDSCIPNQEA